MEHQKKLIPLNILPVPQQFSWQFVDISFAFKQHLPATTAQPGVILQEDCISAIHQIAEAFCTRILHLLWIVIREGSITIIHTIEIVQCLQHDARREAQHLLILRAVTDRIGASSG